jgi:hypothetical protein
MALSGFRVVGTVENEDLGFWGVKGSGGTGYCIGH